MLVYKSSKSVRDYEGKNDLLSCDMDTYNTRKVLYEKVLVCATLTGATCESRKEECAEQKSMILRSKSLPVFTKTGVVANYNLIDCVISYFQ